MNKRHEMPDLGTPGEVAEYLHTTVPTLAQLRTPAGDPKFIKAGRRIRYRSSDVADWLDRNTMRRTDHPCGDKPDAPLFPRMAL
jgi:predicted DNA-binding transcriptional regulator AlpA